MIAFIQENIGTIIIALIIAAIIAVAIISLISKKKRGESSCGCGCSNCAMKGKCRPEKE